MINLPATKPQLLILPTIQDTTLTTNLNVTIQKWCSTCHSILTGLSGAARYPTSLVQVLQSITFYH